MGFPQCPNFGCSQPLTRAAATNTGSFRYVRLSANGNTLTSGSKEVLWDYVRFVPATYQPVNLLQHLYAPNECPFCGNETKHHFTPFPINTFSGNYNYQTTDFEIAAVGQPLRFERSYNSLPVTGTVVYSKPLGYGWTHNYDLKLAFPTDPGGEAGVVILKAPHGSRLRFGDNGNGTYIAYPGVWATMIRGGTGPSSYVYTVTAVSQETFVFTNTGRLIHHLDPQGNATHLTYTGGITLTRVTDAASGRSLDFAYNSAGRLRRVTDHTGRAVTYSYNGSGDLTQVVDTRGMTWTYTYSGNHYLHIVTDPTNRIVEKTFFDSQGRATSQQNGAGQPIVQITYGSNTRTVTEMGRVLTDTYGTNNLLVGQTDALGRSQSYDFDNGFNRKKVMDARHNPITYTYVTTLGLTTAITDALGNRTRFTYDARNNLTSITDARNNTLSYTYDLTNNLKTITTVSGTTVYTYNSRGQVTNITNERGKTITYTYDSATGNLIRITNPLGQQTGFTYDSLGRVTRITNARGIVTRYQYVSNSDLLSAVTENYLTSSCPATECNLITDYGYDRAGRLTSFIDPKSVETRYEYDSAGRLSRVIQNYSNGVHVAGEAPDQDVITRYEYDTNGRLKYIYDPLDRRAYFEYNPLGQVSRVVLNYDDGAYNPAEPDRDVITTYGYDEVGNLTRVTNNAGETMTYVYDTLNRLTQI